MLVSANGPCSGVWSKHSSQRISTIGRIERKKREGGREERTAEKKGRLRSETEKLTVKEETFYILLTNYISPHRIQYKTE